MTRWARVRRGLGAILAGSLSLVLSACTWRRGEAVELEAVRFRVVAPEGIDALYLAGTFNGWSPGAEAWGLARTGNADSWELVVPVDALGSSVIELKLTRGSWDTVEVDESLADRGNRRLELDALAVDRLGTATVELDVAAFADDREPGDGRGPSTVVGRLDVWTIESAALGSSRPVRVWLPPGYDAAENAEREYPVLYLQDGQNLFDAATSFLGAEWRVDETLTELVEAGEVPPWIVVGIDNAGAERSAEYLPSSIALRSTGGRAERYLEFLTEELQPRIERDYRVARGAAHTGIGGSSLGACVSLFAAMERPGRFGALLLESPATWVGGGALLDAAEAHAVWPARVFVGCGDREGRDPSGSEAYVAAFERLEEAFRARGLGSERLRAVLEEGGRHDEDAWARRLPDALRFLLGDAP